MKLRFTIRDLMWLTLVGAMAVGWFIDHRRLNKVPQQDSVLSKSDGRFAPEMDPDWLRLIRDASRTATDK
jgi:hypothetical protein